MFFDTLTEAPPDPIFGLSALFKKDPRKEKVSLAVGIYQDENLQAEIFPSAKVAKERIFSQDLAANYLPIDGLHAMCEQLGPLLFGSLWEKEQERICVAHTVGGTGALRVGAEFLQKNSFQTIAIPLQTWPNHFSIFTQAGLKVEKYPYYNKEKKGVDFEKMASFLKNLSQNSVVILHACCHNPTGLDPTLEEWDEISDIMLEKKLVPFFDCAYQGIGEGLDEDASSIRLFTKKGHEMFIAYSCSKNFSMYGQRVGALFSVSKNSETKQKLESHLKQQIRALYSNPPAHGARIVAEILSDAALKELWRQDLQKVRSRITSMRKSLIEKLMCNKDHMDFGYLKNHKGMFSFLDLKSNQVEKLISEFAIYLTGSGRINVAGLTAANIDYIVESILHVLKGS